MEASTSLPCSLFDANPVDIWFEYLNKGKLNKILTMLENGMNVNICNRYGASSLVEAIRCSPKHSKRYKVIESLIQYNAVVNLRGDGRFPLPLNEAVIFNDIKTVKLLLAAGARVDVLDDRGMSPLHHAAAKSFLEIASILIEYKADINQSSMWGFTPLELAKQNGHVIVNNIMILGDAEMVSCEISLR